MNKFLHFNVRTFLCFTAVLLASAGLAQAIAPGSPEPADYALGFGAASLAFIVWRNVRRSRSRKGES